jgi:hypothetical protein
MQGCHVKITGLEVTRDGHAKRLLVQELVALLGATFATADSRKAWTHVVCVNASRVDEKIFVTARRKQIPVVTLQWIFDSFKANARLPFDSYVVELESLRNAAGAPTEPVHNIDIAAGVLAGHRILISPYALGSNDDGGRLPQLAEELGAVEVQTWRNAKEFEELLRKAITAAAEAQDGATDDNAVVIVLEHEDPEHELVRCNCVNSSCEGTHFVHPSWLLDSFTQRRRMPFDAFEIPLLPSEVATNGCLGGTAVAASPGKRRRVDDGATYAWQSDASTRLNKLAEDSRLKEIQTKAQQKVDTGLRRAAELRCEAGSRLGA